MTEVVAIGSLKARSLVSGLEPFNPMQPNWRIAYNARKGVFTPEARSSLEIIGALNFPSYTLALAATLPLKHSEVLGHTPDHPLKHLFDYDIDAYEYNPNVDNYSILRCYHTNTFQLNISRGIIPVGALHFPKDIATDYVHKLNNKEIIL